MAAHQADLLTSFGQQPGDGGSHRPGANDHVQRHGILASNFM
jgi:hypothetical protein